MKKIVSLQDAAGPITPAAERTGAPTAPTASRSAAGFRSRACAAVVHFVLSLVVVAACAMLLVLRWYPDSWIHAAGGVKLLLLIAGVDLILGPLLTAVVFDRRKRSLPFDLAFIAALQLCALSYGLHAAYQGRPVFNVFVVDRFELLTAADVEAAEHRRARPEFAQLSSSGPTLAAFVAPTDTREKLELTLAAASGVDARYFLRYFVPIDEHWSSVLAAARPISELGNYNTSAAIEHALRPLAGASADRAAWRYLPLQGRHEDLVLVIDGKGNRPLGPVRLTPWSPR